ncbi:MAG TPA: hypothetical protein VHM64_13365 [Candidatus Binatia bacterium]|nr:hypothetical protein [Candidatus Binatia bacterium]
MQLHDHLDKSGWPRDIRRYASRLQHAPSQAGSSNNTKLKESLNFAKVAAQLAGREQAITTGAAADKSSEQFVLWEKGQTFGFADFIDIINPLQHIPIVATVYRNFTGDQLGVASRIIGGGLWGRIGGLVTGVANALVEWWSGKDIGDHIYAALFGAPTGELSAPAVARNKSPVSAPVNSATISLEPEGANTGISAADENSPAAKRDRPGDPRSEALPWPRAARRSYERSRKWAEPDESLGIRLPT